MSSRRFALSLSILVVGIVATACVMWASQSSNGQAQLFSLRVIKSFPHDRNAYSQGLLIHEGRLLEGTGKYGESTLREVDLNSGKVLKQLDLPSSVFGEGIAIAGNRLLQLSWKSRLAFEYDQKTLEPTGKRFSYTGEGWGLTHDGKRWIMSDGTSVLRFLDTETFEEVGSVSVQNEGRRVLNLNELEFVDGQVFANIWKKDTIVRIDPKTGQVTGIINARSIYRSNRRSHDDVLNGIAYDADTKKLYITGKNWPRMYEVKLIAKKRRR